jgi:hypothetical protein
MFIGWLLVVGIAGWTLAFCDWDDEHGARIHAAHVAVGSESA